MKRNTAGMVALALEFDAVLHSRLRRSRDTAMIVKLCRERNVVLATDAGPADVRARLDEGYRMISVGWDFGLLQQTLGDTIGAMRGAIK